VLSSTSHTREHAFFMTGCSQFIYFASSSCVKSQADVYDDPTLLVGTERNSHVREKGRSCSNEGGRRRVGGCKESHGFRMGGEMKAADSLTLLDLFVLRASPPTLHFAPSLPHDQTLPHHGQVPLLVVHQSLRPKTYRLPTAH